MDIRDFLQAFPNPRQQRAFSQNSDASTIEEALNSCNVVQGEQVLVTPEGPSLILKAA
jgi:hypothetical protein